MSRRDLALRVQAAVGASDGDYDLEAIVDDLWQRAGDEPVDDATFWRVVLDHETTTPATLVDVLRDELSATIARTRADRAALWQSGPVSVRLRGVSRVNQTLPQPTAHALVETALESVTLEGDDVTWQRLAEVVTDLADDAEAAQTHAVTTAHAAVRDIAAAETAAADARRRRDDAIRAALAAGVAAAAIVADPKIGLSAAAIQKIRDRK